MGPEDGNNWIPSVSTSIENSRNSYKAVMREMGVKESQCDIHVSEG